MSLRSEAVRIYWQVQSATRGHTEMTLGEAFYLLNEAEGLLYRLSPPPYRLINKLDALRRQLIEGRKHAV